MSWYLLRCKPRQENNAYLNLTRQGYESYFPVVRSDQRKSVLDYEFLFPCYGFVRLTIGQDDFGPIRSTYGVTGLIRFGPTEPLTVPQAVIDSLKAREDNNGIHQICKFDYDRGDKIRVVSGPFEGFEAIFKHRDSVARATILLNGIQKLQLSYRDIEPAA